MIKRICSLLAVFALALGLCACAPQTEPDPVRYSVTVSCSEGFTDEEAAEVLEKVSVVFSKNGTAVDEKTLSADNYGSYADFDLAPDEYDVTLKNVPAEYHIEPETQHVTADKRNIAFDISKEAAVAEQIDYTVTVLDPDGHPMSGITVQFCTTAGQEGVPYTCTDAPLTDEAGKTTLSRPKYSYDVHINSCPEGFTFDNERYKVTPEQPAITVSFQRAS